MPDLTGCCKPSTHVDSRGFTSGVEYATLYNSGSAVRSVEAVGRQSSSARLVLVVTAKYIDILKELTFERVDRIRFQLGPLVSARLVTSRFLSTSPSLPTTCVASRAWMVVRMLG